MSGEPGGRGATPGHFAWQSRSIETKGKRLFTRHSDQFSPGPIGDTKTLTEVVFSASISPLPRNATRCNSAVRTTSLNPAR